MASLITAYSAEKVLNGCLNIFGLSTFSLHTGNPGPTGSENKAIETAKKNIVMPEKVSEAEAAVGAKNVAASEWHEVKASETYAFLGMWNFAGQFLGYCELTEPVTVAIGNTFKMPIGSFLVTA